MPWTSLCQFDELCEGQGRYVEIDGYRLGVYLHEGKVYAMDDTCPHAGWSISAGTIIDGCAVCPRHGWRFDLPTGRVRHAPEIAIRTYPTRLLERPGLPRLVQAMLPMT
jgi:3-phenylpropionate/trans-cinnamate dioxygenase ferredoxin subunit